MSNSTSDDALRARASIEGRVAFAVAAFLVAAGLVGLVAGAELLVRGASKLALSFGIGLTLGVSQPLTLNLTYNRSPAGRSGEVTGLRLTINNITHIAVPLAAGSIGALLGIGLCCTGSRNTDADPALALLSRPPCP